MFDIKSDLTRRDFLRYSGLAAAGIGGAMLLGGCSSSSSSSSTSAASSSSSSQKIKIGVSIWSSTDVLGAQCKHIIDAAADALGVTTTYVDQGHVSDKVTDSVEQLCSAGCQGIIICNSADSEMTSCINTATQNEVYLAQFFRIINKDSSPDVYKVAQNSKYYIGAVHEDEVTNGDKLGTLLLDKGKCRNICLEGWTAGDATFQNRWKGYKQAVDEWNTANPSDKATMTDPQYAGTSSDGGAQVTNSFLNSNPTMDALIVAGGGGDPLVGSIGALKNAGKTGKIKVVSTDFLNDLDSQLASGGIFAESGGHFCDPLYAFLMVYNAVKGNYSKNSGDFGLEIQYPYLYVSSSDDYSNYKKYFIDNDPYTSDEIKSLAAEDFTALKASASKMSIEDVMSRHGSK